MVLALSCVLLSLVLILYTNALRRRPSKHPSKYFNRGLPTAKWTGIALIDGFIGLIHFRNAGVSLTEELSKKYGSSFNAQLAHVRTIATCDPHIIQKLLISTNAGHLNKPKAIYAALLTDALKDGLGLADVGIWAPHRKAISLAFTYKSFPIYLKFMCTGAKNVAKFALLAVNQTPGGVASNKVMKGLIEQQVVKIITEIILGSETCNLSDVERTRFHHHFIRLKDLTLDRFRQPFQLIPAVWFLHPNRQAVNHHVQELFNIADKMANIYRLKLKCVSDSRGKTKRCDEDNDVGENVFSAKSPTKTDDNFGVKPFDCLVEQMINAGYNNDEINVEVVMFLVAGHETILIAMDMLIFHLARNTKIQETCRKEVDTLFDSKSTKTKNFSLEDFSTLKYLERCILETLRITPAIPYFLRQLDTPLEIDNDCFIEAGSNILVLAWALHRNPDIYPDPSKFDPDRFLPENVKKRHPHAFIPFSMGARNCIGWKIAILEMKVIMAWILRSFEFTTTDRLEDVKLLFDVTLKPARPYKVTFQKREQVDSKIEI